MNTPEQESPKEIICDCSGTSKAKIKQLISQGMNSLDQISSATGACSGCGSCDIIVLDILAEAVKRDPETT